MAIQLLNDFCQAFYLITIMSRGLKCLNRLQLGFDHDRKCSKTFHVECNLLTGTFQAFEYGVPTRRLAYNLYSTLLIQLISSVFCRVFSFHWFFTDWTIESSERKKPVRLNLRVVECSQFLAYLAYIVVIGRARVCVCVLATFQKHIHQLKTTTNKRQR